MHILRKLLGEQSHAEITPETKAEIKALWEAEDALSVEQRRARYKCKQNFTIEKDITRWESYEVENPDPTFNKENPVTASQQNRQWFHKKFHLSESDIYARWKESPALNHKVALWRGDITKIELDAILNAANTSLLGGGGIDGAIHSAAGPKLYVECEKLNGCKRGEAKITRGYKLPAKYIIATVGPIGESAEDLYNAYNNSLALAKKHGIKTFALCGVSSGIYGYPLYAASHVALATTRKWLEENHDSIDMIVFCNFLDREVSCYHNLMPLYFPRSNIIRKEEKGEKGEEITSESNNNNNNQEAKGETKEETKEEPKGELKEEVKETKEGTKEEEPKEAKEEKKETNQETKEEELKEETKEYKEEPKEETKEPKEETKEEIKEGTTEEINVKEQTKDVDESSKF